MKKNIITFSVIVGLCVFSYFLGLYGGVQKEDISIENIPISKVDYPLIDISFDNKSDWTVIVRTGLFTECEEYCVSQNAEDLHMNKERLLITTFPIGRGITPNGVVYVYQNQELVKEVPFIEIFFENDILKGSFKYMEKKDVDKLIDSTLPSPI